ncbi:chemotaxis protein [Caballeronia mineralivorans PML1(12)]|uniref:Chemotaxis protein n=1 Tax=Caballeronia mineralivorans PML1(12) TaxID=908627 RepID=A0A0J1CK75_9BURK|nr:methyl-accepting chemotaxis protein [Caballeronia mineralivorans]KLU20851.1 chemotaxis protein [Caballeronia mineralivorans PML1(12)]
MRQLKVVTRLSIAFGALLALVGVVAFVGLFGMAKINDTLKNTVDGSTQEMTLAQTMRSSLDQRSIAIRDMMLVDDKKELDSNIDKIKHEEGIYAAAARNLAEAFAAAGSVTYTEQRILDKLKANEADTLPLMAHTAELIVSGDKAAANKALLQDVRPKQTQWRGTLRELIELEKQTMQDNAALAATRYSQLRIVTVGAALAALLVGVVGALLITRSILSQLGAEPSDAQRVAGEIACGNLTTAVALAPGDKASLMASLEGMRLQLSGMVADIKTSADLIAVAAAEMAQGNVDLSQRTEQQAASLEETAASMEELTSTVKQNTDNANKANQLAQTASDAAAAGGDVVERVVTKMQEISASSSKVGEIITLIEGIAFQTNILALNAAVEAARAGEEGRGFAVVAGEVRALAQRCASAAKQVKDQIGESLNYVDSGSSLANDAGASMEQLLTSVRQVTDIMKEISAASMQQSTGIEQVSTAVSQMDQVTQQNAALVEQATAAAQAMSDQASTLRETVGVFKV